MHCRGINQKSGVDSGMRGRIQSNGSWLAVIANSSVLVNLLYPCTHLLLYSGFQVGVGSALENVADAIKVLSLSH